MFSSTEFNHHLPNLFMVVAYAKIEDVLARKKPFLVEF